MEFPNLAALPEDQVQLVLQGYVAGMMDEKESIIALLKDMQADTQDLVEKAVYESIFEQLSEGDISGE
jgi:hypothetical protein